MQRNRIVEVDSPRAWINVLAAFISCFTVFGVAYSFGAFFRPMGLEFGASRVPTSAVFSITAAVYNLLGAPAGHLADRYGPRRVVIAGAIAMGLGLALTSRIDRLWLGYLTYGLGVGIGVACGYVPMLAVVGGWFSRRRNVALGIAVSGIGCGTLAAAPAAAALIERYGWRPTYVIFAAVSTIMLAGCALLSEAPPVHLHPAPARLAEAIRTPHFVMLYLASVLSSIAIYVPLVYLPEFAHAHGASRVAAAALVGLVGGASVAGRLILGAFGGRAGVFRLYKACLLALGLSYVIWIAAHGLGLLAIFAIAMGASYGGLVALNPSVVAELFGVRGLGAVLGTLYTSSAISALLGPPLAGFIIDMTGGYSWAIAIAGATSIAAFFIVAPLGAIPATIRAGASETG